MEGTGVAGWGRLETLPRLVVGLDRRFRGVHVGYMLPRRKEEKDRGDRERVFPDSVCHTFS